MAVGEGNAAFEQLALYKEQRKADSVLIASLQKEAVALRSTVAASENQTALCNQRAANLSSQMKSKDDIINVQKGTIDKLANRPPKRFGIGASLGYGTSLNSIKLQPVAALTLQYNFIRL